MDEAMFDPAKSDGRIQHGDELVEVDGKSVVGLSYQDGLAIIKGTAEKATFRVKRRNNTEQPLVVGAVFAASGASIETPLIRDGASEGSHHVDTEGNRRAPLLSISELLNLHHPEMEPSRDTGSSTDLTSIVVNLDDTPQQATPLGKATPTESMSRARHPLESATIKNTDSHERGIPDDHDDDDDDDREGGDDDLTDVTVTETESDDEAPPPLPMSPLPEPDTPTHTLRVVD